MGDRYYILAAENPNRMLLYSLPDPTDNPFQDRWQYGRVFSAPPNEPIIATIKTNYENKELMSYFDVQPVMSVEFYNTLVKAGVNNLDAYDCVIRSEDRKIEYKGFKAVNIIGLISATGDNTKFSGKSRLFDASMENINIDPSKAKHALMFRLAENTSTVIVHESVKQNIEKENFPDIVFREPEETVVL